MSGTKRFNVDLPVELADLVEAKVASGEYDSVSDVLAEGLRALQEDDPAVERWLYEEVAPTYDAWKRDPSRGVPLEEAFDGLEARYQARKAKMSRAG